MEGAVITALTMIRSLNYREIPKIRRGGRGSSGVPQSSEILPVRLLKRQRRPA